MKRYGKHAGEQRGLLPWTATGILSSTDFSPKSEIAPISDEVNRIIEGKTDYMPAKELVYEPNSNPPRVRNANRLHLYRPLFLEFAKSPKLLEPLEEILGKPLTAVWQQRFRQAGPSGNGRAAASGYAVLAVRSTGNDYSMGRAG